jgi:hypothetical protein
MAKRLFYTRQAIALVVVAAMLGLAPVSTFADHKKYFKEGIRFEENKQWDKAAEKFALAVAEKPSNVEYQLHFQRCLVNAGIMLVERGDRLAEQRLQCRISGVSSGIFLRPYKRPCPDKDAAHAGSAGILHGRSAFKRRPCRPST